MPLIEVRGPGKANLFTRNRHTVRRLTSKVLADAKKDAKNLNYLIKNLHLEKIIEIALYINIRDHALSTAA